MNARVLSAGLAGGMAEVLLVAGYGVFGMVSAGEVAREVTASFAQGAAGWRGAAALGVVIHLALSVAVAYAFVAALGRFTSGRRSIARQIAIGVAALVGVWALNFLVVLPAVNPSFVALMPYAATLLSKALFGAVMATVLAQTALTTSCP